MGQTQRASLTHRAPGRRLVRGSALAAVRFCGFASHERRLVDKKIGALNPQPAQEVSENFRRVRLLISVSKPCSYHGVRPVCFGSISPPEADIDDQ